MIYYLIEDGYLFGYDDVVGLVNWNVMDYWVIFSYCCVGWLVKGVLVGGY